MMKQRTAFTAAVGHATKVSNSILRSLATASARGNVGEARRLQYAYFRSRECRLACAAQVWARFGRPRRLAPILAIATQLNCREQCRDAVVFHDKRKRSGLGTRRTFEFGLQHTLRQVMVAKVLRATFRPPGWQFEHRGKGREKAVAQIASHIAAGNVYVGVVDIKNCFDSFDAGKVPNLLPLSSRIARNVLLVGGLNLRDGNVRPGAVLLHHQAPRLQSTGCLPQGSVASGLVASILLSDLGEVVMSQCHLIGFVDDLVVLGRTRAAVDESLNALEAALLEHRSGRLEPKRRPTVHVETGFEFLGYRIALEGGVIRIRPSEDNLDRIEAAFWGIAMRQEAGLPIDESLRAFSRKLAAFPSWTGASDHMGPLIDAANDHRQAHDVLSRMLECPTRLSPEEL